MISPSYDSHEQRVLACVEKNFPLLEIDKFCVSTTVTITLFQGGETTM